ncbi:hypothetical protein C5S39_06470 [Candidatus Methanophagaceae archaeon]|nr:hypothetical protein C5S39_06470 [Methanophagales archaeon]
MNKRDIVKQESDFVLDTGNDVKVKNKKVQIRNSTVEFLIFTKQNNKNTIGVRIEDETVWLTQKLMSVLFEKGRSTITEHLQNIFETGELKESSVCRDFRHTAEDGKEYTTKFYNLDAIIAVGFRVNSERATQFRQWAINILRDFAIRGYVLDNERLKNGSFFNNEITKTFFATVQNKLHFATHGNTAAELIMERANSNKEHMGLTTWKNAPHGKIIKPDVSIAKNYLSEKEIKALDRITTMYLDYAEDQAEQNIPMTMEDWSKKLNVFLQFNNRELLDNPGKVAQEIAKAFAESEFGKYRIVQDQLFESDFDKMIKKLEDNSEGKV